MDPRGLAELVPDFAQTAPLDSPVTADAAYFLTAGPATAEEYGTDLPPQWRTAFERDRERIRDLIVHVLRAAAGPVGEHDDLLLANVRDRIDRRVLERVPSAADHRDNGDDDEKRVVQAPANDRVH